MAEGEDPSQKTEEPTQRKLDEARKKGQVVTSREVNHWFVIMAGLVLMFMFVPTMMRNISGILRPFIEMPHDIPTDLQHLRFVFSETAGDVLYVMTVPMAFLILAALLSSFVQHGFILSGERIKPKIEKISPLSGMKRLFSYSALMEFTKGILKLLIVGVVTTLLILTEFASIEMISSLEIPKVMELVHSLSVRMFVAVFAVMTVIAGLDFMFQKYEFTKKMRMSKQELKDEYKQTEGDPLVKSRLRQIRMERARRRMMAKVPSADVVVTNPTHYAVALKYDQPAAMEAPVCVAKGVDSLALRIREIAAENGVVVVENPLLAQALYASVEIDEEIPEEHYRAVAEVIGYVYRIKGKTIH